MHSVPHHCLDVAASAAVLLAAFRAPVAVPAAALTTLVALHDIGKFTRPFQAKVPELWPPSLGDFPGRLPGFHDDAGYALLCGALARRVDRLFVNWRAANSRYPIDLPLDYRSARGTNLGRGERTTGGRVSVHAPFAGRVVTHRAAVYGQRG